jgi:hypothetical protein
MTITERHGCALVDAAAGWDIPAIYDAGDDLKERLVNADLLGADGKLTEAGRQEIAGRWRVPGPTRRRT